MATKCCSAQCCSCCSNGDSDDDTLLDQPDECTCGCGCYNGNIPIIVSHFLLACGIFLSFAALGDCAFVQVTEPVGVSLVPGKFTATSLGMLRFQMEDGQCYMWDDYYVSVEEQVQFYMEIVLGPDWYRSINFAVTADACGILVFLYLTSYCCSTQIRLVRYATGIVAFITATFQGLTFMVYNTQWCEDNGCSFGRSAGLSVGAAVCFFLAGLAFFFTRNYPGIEAAAMAAAQRDHKISGVAANDDAAASALEEGAPPHYSSVVIVSGGRQQQQQEQQEGRRSWQSYD
jgi:hypothetical protein